MLTPRAIASARRVEDEETGDGYLSLVHRELPRGPFQPARQVDRRAVERLVDAGRRYARESSEQTPSKLGDDVGRKVPEELRPHFQTQGADLSLTSMTQGPKE